MNRKVTAGILLVLGIVLVVVGIVIMAVIVPGMKQFPDDVDTTREYAGTMTVLLNPDTFEFMKDLEVDLERHFKTEETDGDIALVIEEQTLSSGGQPLQSLTKHYALNRKTMEFAKDYPESWAETDGFWDREGLVLGWPIDTEKKDYVGWSDDYRSTVELKYEEEVEHDRAKIDTYLFTASDPSKLIDPAAVQAMGLPLELPTEQFGELVQGADVSDTLKTMLPAVLRQWEEDTVPLVYYYEYEGWYWIEPQTGVLIDTKKHELRTVGLGEAFMESSPLLSNMSEEQRAASRVPVFDLLYQGTDDTVQDAKKDAEDAISQLQLFGTIIPIAAIVIGAILAIVGVFLLVRTPAAPAA
jgi:uncharacterized membrane protein